MKKKGMELQISFIVILIISVATLALSLVFVANLFNKANKMQSDLDSQTEEEINKALDSGQKVSIPINRKEIARNKFDSFGIGVFNTEKTDKTDFIITIKFSAFFKKTNNEPDNCPNEQIAPKNGFLDNCEQSFYPVKEMITVLGDFDPGTNTAKITIDAMTPNQKTSKVIGVNVPSYAASGTYVFDAVVYSRTATAQTQYGEKQKIYVKVQ